jgi:hypothetical protein
MKQYIRNNKKQKIGMITATVKDDKVLVGYSKCKKTDKFDREIGEIISDVRSKAEISALSDIPYDIKKAIPHFVHSHERSFGNAKLPSWVEVLCK